MYLDPLSPTLSTRSTRSTRSTLPTPAVAGTGALASLLACFLVLGCADNDPTRGGKAGDACTTVEQCKGTMVCGASGFCVPPQPGGGESADAGDAGDAGESADEGDAGGAGAGAAAGGDPGGEGEGEPPHPGCVSACEALVENCEGAGTELACDAQCSNVEETVDLDALSECLACQAGNGVCGHEGFEPCMSDPPKECVPKPAGEGEGEGEVDGGGEGDGGATELGADGEGEGEVDHGPAGGEGEGGAGSGGEEAVGGEGEGEGG